MSVAAVLILAVAVSVDGFWGGLAFGLRRLRIPAKALSLVALITVFCTCVTMEMGRLMQTVVPFAATKWLSAALLISMGVIALFDGVDHRSRLHAPGPGENGSEGEISVEESVCLGLAVALDASVAAFSIGLAGYSPLVVPWLIGLIHFLLVGLGNYFGSRKRVVALVQGVAIIPGTILIAIGLLRVF